ncbi:AAA family ATPase [Chitinophaga sp. G-6-1-13]|uniref:AAA family ATPase n=1 Tax=Chitinophaga fulva TaxID=2728842 RepID=A0A848GW07_9BACT|nr:AAA family ATPase [Chitinophaga fulva]NML40880.1 AAA family ATPase [Chitinophaga fulva]
MADYHRLNNIHIKGYKSIEDQNIGLEDINVLIGQNGAGKTNFISLFRFLRNIIQERLKNTSLTNGAESLLYYGSKTTGEIKITLDFDPNYYEIGLQPTRGDSLLVSGEYCGYRGSFHQEPYWELITRSEEESTLSKAARSSKVAEYVYNVLQEWRVYHFHDTSETAGMKKYGAIANNKFLLEDASNLAAFLYILKKSQEQYYERIVKTVQLVIPFFKDFVLEPNPLNEENIRLEWHDLYSDKIFTANELSDGSLRFICMATLLLQKKLPKLILLDEPELGLHPTAITILAGLLKKASKRTQVIVSTQSVSLVNEFDAENILVVDRNMGATIFNRLDPEKLESWLDQYSLGDLWDKNVIGGNP